MVVNGFALAMPFPMNSMSEPSLVVKVNTMACYRLNCLGPILYATLEKYCVCLTRFGSVSPA